MRSIRIKTPLHLTAVLPRPRSRLKAARSMCEPSTALNVALVDAEDAEKWRGYGEVLYQEAFAHPNDIVTSFRAPLGEFPLVQDVADGKFDAIYVTGSHYSAYEDLPWINDLMKLLPSYAATGRVRIIGLCFGHQLLARAFGGTVGKNPSGRFVLKVEDVIFDSSALARAGLLAAFSPAPGRIILEPEQGSERDCHLPGLDPPTAASDHAVLPAPEAAGGTPQEGEDCSRPGVSLGMSGLHDFSSGSPMDALEAVTLPLLQSHGDQVLELPRGAVRLATSATASIEMWMLRDTCMACQFHPEWDTTDQALEKIFPAISTSGRLEPQEVIDSEASLRGIKPAPARVRALMRAFMEGRTGMGGTSAAGRSCSTATSPASGDEAALDAGLRPPERGGESAASGASTAHVAAVEARGEMAAELEQLVTHMRASFGAGLQQGALEWELLAGLNQAASGKCANMADVAAALAEFANRVSDKQSGVRGALAGMTDLEAQLDLLSRSVDDLDLESQRLLKDSGAPEGSGTVAGWGSYMGGVLGWPRQ